MPEYRGLIEYAEDDGAVQSRPERHVDYLSHDWREEDIWSSWKLVVSRRKAYNDSARLENASWRAWAKWRNQLKTISPETLNWFKDCDVTWLYGPLQKWSNTESRSVSAVGSNRLSKSDPPLNKMPILKKQSASKIMLQRSLSSSTLLRRAAAAIHSQHSIGFDRPYLGQSDIALKTLTSRTPSGHHTSLLSSVSPGSQSPGPLGHEKRHIHFNERVEQRITLDIKGTDSATENVGKTIAVLPSTTLKYVDTIPKPHETTLIYSNGWYQSRLRPSHAQKSHQRTESQETALAHSDDDIDWLPQSSIGCKKSMIANQERSQNTLDDSSPSPNDENAGMRTLSGAFVQNDVRVFGLLGKAVGTLNTARDIAHVIWNVGGG